MKIVEVVWVDAQSSISSMDTESAKEYFHPQRTSSVGMLIYESDEILLLAFAKVNNGTYKHWQSIPKGSIKSQKTIKEIKL